ncbi:mechanosensitive ion channel family protein [Streptomyces chartreusis]|uniref:mechanosensitive ion channel family protein n=1 Tax=Streptomyces chartreusis TaxID=1969 RepID=UPI003F53F66E
MVLDQVGIALGPLMASAGVVGLAIGFGAQSLVADYLSGLLITVEDQYGVGDSVDLGEAVGEVERVGLRLTHVRDLNGGLRHIRNGEILRVRNDSQDWARAVLDVAVAYDANLDTVYRVLEEAGQGLRQEPAFADLLLEDPAVWGVQSLDADGVIVRIAVKATPLQQWAVTRELRRRVKDALDEAGIDIPFPPARHLAAYGGRGRRSRAVCSVTFGEVAGLPRGADPPPGSTLGSFLWYEAHRWDGRIVAGEAGGGDVASERAAASDSVRRGGPAARARRDRRGGAGRRGLEGLRQPRPGRVRCGGGTRRACTAVGCGPSSPGGQGPGAGAGATGAGRGQHAGRRTDTTPRSCLRQGDTAMPGPEASGPLAGPRKT